MSGSLSRLIDAGLDFISPARVMSKAGLPPDPWQVDLLDDDTRNVFVLCCRQAGKSTGAAAKAFKRARVPRSLVLLIAPTLRQSGELFRKVLQFWKPVRKEMPAESFSKLTVEFKNGSRIIALPGNEDTVVGFSAPDLIIIDEASLIADSLYMYLRPMLSIRKGQLVCLGTPRGKRGFFFDTLMDPESRASKYTVTAPEIPRHSPEFLEEERRVMGQYWFEQEYMCVFHDLTDSLFSLDQIEAATTEHIEALTFDEPAPGDTGVRALEL